MPWDALATVELEYPLAHVVEEVAVVGYGDDCTLILLQMLLEPVDALGVEVIGGLVEEQHVGFLKEQAAESHAAALTTREVGDGQVASRTAQGCHGAVEFGVHIPCVGGVDDVLDLGLTLHELVHLVGVAVVLLFAKLAVDFFVFGEGVIDLLHAFHHVLLDGLGLVEWWVLWQIAHAVAGAPYHLALCGLFQSGDNLHQGRFTGAIQTDDTYLGTIEE